MATTVLYVEDEPDDAFFMRAAFRRVGVAVQFEVAADGLAAIAYLTGDKPYDDRAKYPLPGLVLLDLNLPGLSGFEVLAWLRQQPNFQALPVIVFSSSGRPDDRKRARELGATDYLMKPNSGQQFSEIARQVQGSWLEKPASSPKHLQ